MEKLFAYLDIQRQENQYSKPGRKKYIQVKNFPVSTQEQNNAKEFIREKVNENKFLRTYFSTDN